MNISIKYQYVEWPSVIKIRVTMLSSINGQQSTLNAQRMRCIVTFLIGKAKTEYELDETTKKTEIKHGHLYEI